MSQLTGFRELVFIIYKTKGSLLAREMGDDVTKVSLCQHGIAEITIILFLMLESK